LRIQLSSRHALKVGEGREDSDPARSGRGKETPSPFFILFSSERRGKQYLCNLSVARAARTENSAVQPHLGDANGFGRLRSIGFFLPAPSPDGKELFMPRRQRVVAKAPITPNAIDSCTAYPCDYTISICNVALRDEMQKSHFQEVPHRCEILIACEDYALSGASGAGEPPPCALPKPGVSLSTHRAPIIQPSVAPRTANAETTVVAVWLFLPARKPLW